MDGDGAADGLRIGALVIGSLLWDTRQPARAAWHARWLDLDERYAVAAPIRYGRRSASRAHTFTMVLAPCTTLPERCGRAWVIPFREPVADLAGLEAAASAMGDAEGFGRAGSPAPGASGLADHWGAVGILGHPRLGGEPPWLEGWARRSRDRARLHGLHRVRAVGEGPAIDERGRLAIPWPEPLEPIRSDVEPDLLLATVNRPTLVAGAPPAASEIAAAMRAAGDRGYFDANRAAAITTPDDDDILRALDEGAPEGR